MTVPDFPFPAEALIQDSDELLSSFPTLTGRTGERSESEKIFAPPR